MLISVILIFLVLSFDPSGSNARNPDYKLSSMKDFIRRFPRQIVPGTKWCGNGDKASDDNDLGRFRDTDMCCREHDKCPRNIAGHETKFGLTNPDMSTRSHCDCDQKFFQCLVNATSGISSTIGGIYFNLLQKKCFREKSCPLGETCNEVEYEWVEANTWLPTEDELMRLYYNMGLIIPELEFDSR